METLISLVAVFSVIGIPITFIIFIIQAIRKKPNKKIWGFASLGCLAVLIICFIASPPADSTSQEPVSEKTTVTETTKKQTTAKETTTKKEKYEKADLSVNYKDIYLAYKKNELSANEKYEYNRYRVKAKVNKIDTDGMFNMTGGATLTMQCKVNNTIVLLSAEFEKDQEKNLKNIAVGDTIVFEGKCLSSQVWSECIIIDE